MLCSCGCGSETKNNNLYVNGHNRKNKKHSQESIEKIRQSKIGNPSRTGMKCSEETKSRMRHEHKKGFKMPPRSAYHRKCFSDNMKKRNPMQDPEIRKRHSIRMKELRNDPNSVYHSEEYFENLRISRNIKPNKPESLILKILNDEYPEQWEFVGDFKIWINGKNPDFICYNKKLIIEHFGDWWHKDEDPKIREKIFKESGYQTLIIWERELRNIESVKQKINNFINR